MANKYLTAYMNDELVDIDPNEVGGYIGVQGRVFERMDMHGILYGPTGPGDLAHIEILVGCPKAPPGAQFWIAA